MTDPFLRALTGHPGRRTVSLQRDYRCEPADLWSALTEPERLARWFGRLTEVPGGVGDSFTAELSDEPGDVGRGLIRVCDGRSRLAYSWQWGDEPAGLVDVTLVPVPEGTRLFLTHALLGDRGMAGYGGGWEQILGELARAFDPATTAVVESEAVGSWRELSTAPVEIVRRLAAPPEQVWTAWTTVHGLRSWWWSHWPDVQFTVDLKIGGGYAITAPQGGFTVRGDYLAIEAPHHLAFTWQWVDGDGVTRDEACDLELVADGNGTLLTLRHTGPWPDDAGAENYRIGWTQTLDSLDRLLS